MTSPSLGSGSCPSRRGSVALECFDRELAGDAAPPPLAIIDYHVRRADVVAPSCGQRAAVRSHRRHAAGLGRRPASVDAIGALGRPARDVAVAHVFRHVDRRTLGGLVPVSVRLSPALTARFGIIEGNWNVGAVGSVIASAAALPSAPPSKPQGRKAWPSPSTEIELSARKDTWRIEPMPPRQRPAADASSRR